jgi:hypothetical protein
VILVASEVAVWFFVRGARKGQTPHPSADEVFGEIRQSRATTICHMLHNYQLQFAIWAGCISVSAVFQVFSTTHLPAGTWPVSLEL